jgi:Bacterial regulatory protein, Fis family
MTAPRAVEEYVEALRDARGLISVAARRLGVTRQAVRQRIAKHPSLREVRDEAREAMTDIAESALYEQILRGEAWAVCFYLKTQGKDRGYVERSTSAVAVGGDVRIRIETVDDRGDPRTR